MPELREITTDEGWAEAIPILRQLWSHEDEAFVRSFRDEDDYRLLGWYDDDDLVAVAGVSIQRVLHHSRHAWVHDFVVDEGRRSEGHGARLLDAVEEWARERDCEYVALGVTLDSDEAVEFYEREGMERWGHVIETEL